MAVGRVRFAPAVLQRGKRARNRRRRADVIAASILTLLVLWGLFPYLFMLISSLKDNFQFYHNYWSLVLPFHFENYAVAWSHISGYMLNSLLVAIASTLGVILLSSISAFALSRPFLIGRQFLFIMIAALMMVPSIASLIPLFVMVHDFGWLNTYLVLIIPYIAGGTVLGTFLMKAFIEQMTKELFEAAQLDGASNIQLYLRLILPLSGPIIGSITIITLINVWNDYFWPLLTVTDDQLRTVAIGLAFLQGQYVTNWGPLFAGYVLASLPLLLIFTFASRYFIAGIQATGGEGVK